MVAGGSSSSDRDRLDSCLRMLVRYPGGPYGHRSVEHLARRSMAALAVAVSNCRPLSRPVFSLLSATPPSVARLVFSSCRCGLDCDPTRRGLEGHVARAEHVDGCDRRRDALESMVHRGLDRSTSRAMGSLGAHRLLLSRLFSLCYLLCNDGAVGAGLHRLRDGDRAGRPSASSEMDVGSCTLAIAHDGSHDGMDSISRHLATRLALPPPLVCPNDDRCRGSIGSSTRSSLDSGRRGRGANHRCFRRNRDPGDALRSRGMVVDFKSTEAWHHGNGPFSLPSIGRTMDAARH